MKSQITLTAEEIASIVEAALLTNGYHPDDKPPVVLMTEAGTLFGMEFTCETTPLKVRDTPEDEGDDLMAIYRQSLAARYRNMFGNNDMPSLPEGETEGET